MATFDNSPYQSTCPDFGAATNDDTDLTFLREITILIGRESESLYVQKDASVVHIYDGTANSVTPTALLSATPGLGSLCFAEAIDPTTTPLIRTTGVGSTADPTTTPLITTTGVGSTTDAAGATTHDPDAPAFREDNNCGVGILAPNGYQAECNPDGPSPCCSEFGWCGGSPLHCDCVVCIDFRGTTPTTQAQQSTNQRTTHDTTPTTQARQSTTERNTHDTMSTTRTHPAADRTTRGVRTTPTTPVITTLEMQATPTTPVITTLDAGSPTTNTKTNPATPGITTVTGAATTRATEDPGTTDAVTPTKTDSLATEYAATPSTENDRSTEDAAPPSTAKGQSTEDTATPSTTPSTAKDQSTEDAATPSTAKDQSTKDAATPTPSTANDQSTEGTVKPRTAADQVTTDNPQAGTATTDREEAVFEIGSFTQLDEVEFSPSSNTWTVQLNGVFPPDVDTGDITTEVENDEVQSFRGTATVTMDVISVTPGVVKIGVTTDTSAKWNFTVKIQGRRVVLAGSMEPIKIRVLAKHIAPPLPSARFTDSGNAITFEFGVPVRGTINGSDICGGLFRDAADLLGSGATCFFRTARELYVTVGKGENLVEPGDGLTIQANTITLARQRFAHPLTTTKSISIDPPTNPIPVDFAIAGPSRINYCGIYQLKAEQATGHGGRKMDYLWELISPDGEVAPSSLSSGSLSIVNDGNNGFGRPILDVNASTLSTGEEYTVSFTVSSFLGRSQVRMHTMQVSSGINPVLEIEPTNVIPERVKLSTRVKLTSVISYSFGSDCKIEVDSTTYKWTTNVTTMTLDEDTGRTLLIPPFTLPVNEATAITVTVTSTIGGETKETNETITLTTVTSALIAHINGASKVTIGPSDGIDLDGSSSFDPDTPPGDDSTPLNFQWTCLDAATDRPCDGDLGTERQMSSLSMAPSSLTPGRYTITLEVSKDIRTAQASMDLIVDAETVPIVKLKTRLGKVKYRDDEDIYLQANVKSESSVTITWEETSGRLDSSSWATGAVRTSGGTHTTHTNIPSSQTAPGSEYTIEVKATNENGRTGIATFDITIYESVSQCQVEATPYIEMETMTITASGCVTDPDSQPLTYQPFLGIPQQAGDYKKVVLDGSKRNFEQTVIATPIDYRDDQVPVGFKVCDAILQCIDAITITNYTSRDDDLANADREIFIDDKITVELEKGNLATAFSNAINMANLEKKLVSKRRRRKRDAFYDLGFDGYTFAGDLDSILLVVEDVEFYAEVEVETQERIHRVEDFQTRVLSTIVSSGTADSNEADMILDLAPQMVQQEFTEEDIDTTLAAIRQMYIQAQDEGHQQRIGTVERALITLGITEKNLNADSTRNKRQEQWNKINNLRRDALKQAGMDLNVGNRLALNISGTHMAVYCFLPDGEGAAWEPDDSIPVAVRPGQELTNMFSYDWCQSNPNEACTGIKALLIQVRWLDGYVEQCSESIDVTFVNPVTDDELPIESLSDRLEIELPQYSVEDGKICVCKYWNEGTSQLETTGVATSYSSDGSLICGSEHLTRFVGEKEDAPVQDMTTQSTKGPSEEVNAGFPMPMTVGIIVGAILAILLALLVVFICYKVNREKKVRPDGE